ncbi:unnamed protein product [Pleuronectes platessa]|uniref:Uncharacterized protein n=1 Tax=Pleuronectes platessa TaxID=8262 RepID=A0A9N7VTT3_PLEPL|nr:unnamed protein product [Pleuronectes platessa]
MRRSCQDTLHHLAVALQGGAGISEASEVQPSKLRSLLPHRLSKELSDFATLCVKSPEGSFKEAAGPFGIGKVNVSQGSGQTQSRIVFMILKLGRFAFPLA